MGYLRVGISIPTNLLSFPMMSYKDLFINDFVFSSLPFDSTFLVGILMPCVKFRPRTAILDSSGLLCGMHLHTTPWLLNGI